MSPVSVDPVEVRIALERQLALLTPVVEHLRAAATDAGPLVADEWRGHAADMAARFLTELRARLGESAEAVDDVVRQLRIDIARML